MLKFNRSHPENLEIKELKKRNARNRIQKPPKAARGKVVPFDPTVVLEKDDEVGRGIG